MAGKKKKWKQRPVKKRRIKLCRAVLESLDLPQETEPTIQKLTMVGEEDVLVENHKGVLRYDAKKIRLVTHSGEVHIEGEELMLKELSDNRAYVKGRIFGISFHK